MFNDILLAINTNKGVKLFPDYSKAFTVYAPYTLTQDCCVIAISNQTDDHDRYLPLMIDGIDMGSKLVGRDQVSLLCKAGTTIDYKWSSSYRTQMCIIPLQTR